MAMAVEQQPAGASAPSPPPRIRILDTALVRPSPLPSGSAAPECSLPLTFFDVFWLTTPPVERLFLYRLAPDADVPAILSNLKDSLSQAVGAFYPLAGHLRLTPGTSNRYELHYRPGDGVAFTVAEYDAGGADEDIDALAADDPREVARIAPLVPLLPDGGAVLALQATLLPARCGLAVGVTVHHAACDGSASTQFLHTWAAAACARADAAAAPPPVIDRSLIPDPLGLYDVFFPRARASSTGGEMRVFKAPVDQLMATFTVSMDDVQRVKDAVAAEAARRGVALPRSATTSLVATLSLVWSCYLRAKDDDEATATSADRARACLLFPVDHRSRMKPPIPDKYFGNCVGPALCLAPRDEAAAAGAGGLFSACAAVAAAIDEAVSGIGTPSMGTWGERVVGVARSIGMLSVAGSPRFRVYDLDLGFGRPAKVDIVSVAKTGAVGLAESRYGAGGMEVGVSLPRDGMDRFRKSFADAIAALQCRT